MHPSNPILAPTIRGYIFFLGWWSVRSLFTHIYNGFSVCLTTQNHFSLPVYSSTLAFFCTPPFSFVYTLPMLSWQRYHDEFSFAGATLASLYHFKLAMFYLLLFCNLKFERFIFRLTHQLPSRFSILAPLTTIHPHNTQPVLVVLCRDGGHIFPEVNGVAWRT